MPKTVQRTAGGQVELAQEEACEQADSMPRGNWTGPGHEWWFEEWAKSMSSLEQRPIHAWEVREMVENLKDGECLRIAAPPREQADEQADRQADKQADSRPTENWTGHDCDWWFEGWPESWLEPEQSSNQLFEDWPESWLEPEQSSNQLEGRKEMGVAKNPKDREGIRTEAPLIPCKGRKKPPQPLVTEEGIAQAPQPLEAQPLEVIKSDPEPLVQKVMVHGATQTSPMEEVTEHSPLLTRPHHRATQTSPMEEVIERAPPQISGATPEMEEISGATPKTTEETLQMKVSRWRSVKKGLTSKHRRQYKQLMSDQEMKTPTPP
ncbi:Hypothetical predicted protein [Xyrichtys novacula]|uniref:Uncharacterized protein n=1 Tax=Xyrichtys novacula TaxID=13765 RepID=A0AAV1F4F7_XYRNO|nr:Hypothetical predicted protein [Xyrichtys novacula]